MVRFKNRYIAIEVVPADKTDQTLVLKPNALYHAIQQKVGQLYGDFGLAAIKSGFNAKYCNTHTKIAFVKVRHGPHKFLLNAIPAINDVGGRLVKVNIVYVGATMKHCFIFIRRYQQRKLEEMWGSFRNDIERKKMEEALMKCTHAMKSFN